MSGDLSSPQIPFSMLSSLVVEPIIAYRRTVIPRYADQVMTNPHTTWWGVEHGQIEVLTRDHKWKVTTGNWILIPPGLRRRHIITLDTRLISFGFRAMWKDGIVLDRFPAPLVDRFATSKSLVTAALRVCNLLPDPLSMLHEQQFGISNWLRFHAALLAFVAEALDVVIRSGGEMTHPQTRDARLDHVVNGMSTNLRVGPLPYAEWQRQVGLSRVQLDRLAHRWLGESLHARRNILLRNAIRHQLAIGPHSIKELASRFGFVDAAHLTHWVRRHTGKKPKDLRGALV
jgi:AraC-like DNA-binding protein